MTSSETKSERLVRKTYRHGVFLTIFLFAVHTMIIFELAFNLNRFTERIMHYFGVHVGGPLIIIFCFFALFTTHIFEAATWALFFWKKGEFSHFGESMYFTGTSLTALGYGDVVLHTRVRGLGPIMATNGILMFGCSTAFLFFVIQKIWAVMQ